MMENQNRLRELREAAGLTSAEVATLTGRATSQTVHRWETGITPIPDDAKLVLSREFQVSVETLMGWDRQEAAA